MQNKNHSYLSFQNKRCVCGGGERGRQKNRGVSKSLKNEQLYLLFLVEKRIFFYVFKTKGLRGTFFRFSIRLRISDFYYSSIFFKDAKNGCNQITRKSNSMDAKIRARSWGQKYEISGCIIPNLNSSINYLWGREAGTSAAFLLSYPSCLSL